MKSIQMNINQIQFSMIALVCVFLSLSSAKLQAATQSAVLTSTKYTDVHSSSARPASNEKAKMITPIIISLLDEEAGDADETPMPPPVADGEVTVSSVAELTVALADNSIGKINVQKGNYYVDKQNASGNGFRIGHNVIITAVGNGGGRANFYARNDFLKGIFLVSESVSVMFNGIGFYDTRTRFGSGESSNEAGIRHEGADLIIVNCVFKENYNGILGTQVNEVGDATLHVQRSTFLQNGHPSSTSGQEHHLYFQGKSSIIEDSSFTDSGTGHPIKTVVSDFSKVINNVIDDAGANANHAVNLEGGGDLTATGNNITKRASSTNPYVFYVFTVRNGGRAGSINIADNIIHTEREHTLLLGNVSDSVAYISNNTLTGSFNIHNIVFSDARFSGTTLNGSSLDGTDWRSTATQLTQNNDELFLTGAGSFYLNYSPALVYEGLGGNDVMVASPNKAASEVFFGGDGNDVLSGGQHPDFLFGEDGDDIIFAGTHGSWAFGGDGDDWLVSGPEYIGSSGSSFTGGAGNDILDGRNTNLVIMDGGPDNDLLIGSSGPDKFNGGAGDDIVYGGDGLEGYYYGGSGIDTMVYASNYGTDLKVEFDYGRYLKIRFVPGSDAGRIELGGQVEKPYQFEFIQFANGVYDIAARQFRPGEVRQGADLSQILATPYPTHPVSP